MQKGPEGYIWEERACNKWGGLFKGWKEYKGLDMIGFIRKQDIPKGRKATYIHTVCAIRPQKEEKYCVNIIMGGKLIKYPYSCTTPTLDHTTLKCHWNSVIYDLRAKYCYLDIKKICIYHKMQQYK